ncbi:hypothetical protein KEJ19_08000, partial [Candidatus Bathyarchaeota archaeon]|nr:hypothetical protein [Candidatus Bathyarchaeota archaeon]
MIVSFTEALPLFTGILTLVYLAILKFTERSWIEARHKEIGVNIFPVLLVLALLVFALLHIPGFKLTLFYLLIVSSLSFVFLLYITAVLRANSRSVSRFALPLVIVLHLLIVYNPPYGLYFDEWTQTLAEMVLTGHYEPLPTRSTYNPFPMHAGLSIILTYVTGLPLIQKVSMDIPPLLILLAIDLVLLSIAKRLTADWKVGILAVFLYAITPPANFIDHPAKLSGLMLVFIATFMFVLAFERRRTWNNVVTEKLAYIGGIFYHATAGLGIFILGGILVFGGLMSNLTKEQVWKSVWKSSTFRLALASFIVIILTKWVWGGGIGNIAPSLYRNFLAMMQWKEMTGGYAPLYVRTKVNPLHAYAWATPIAMASALLLYTLISIKKL